MKLLLFFMIPAGLFLAASCTTSKRTMSNVRAEEINDLQYFEHLSYVHLIEKSNQGRLNDSLSSLSGKAFREAMSGFNAIPVTGEITADDPLLKKRVAEEVKHLLYRAGTEKIVADILLPSTLDSLLEIRGKRFGLITVTGGFSRVQGNYGKQLGKGFLIGLATLGTYVPVATKSNSTVSVLIIDSEQDNIAFYRRSVVDEGDPLKVELLTEQVNKIFRGYFWKK